LTLHTPFHADNVLSCDKKKEEEEEEEEEERNNLV